jgi:hypothetical protein
MNAYKASLFDFMVPATRDKADDVPSFFIGTAGSDDYPHPERLRWAFGRMSSSLMEYDNQGTNG